MDIGDFEFSIQQQTIAFGPLDGRTYGDADFAIGASSTSALPVSFTASGNASVRQVNGVWYVHILGAGNEIITAQQVGNASYYAASDVAESLIHCQGQRDVMVTPYRVTYDGNAHTATGTATGVKAKRSRRPEPERYDAHQRRHYPGDAWIFTDSTGNYNNAHRHVSDSIAKANAVMVTPYASPTTATPTPRPARPPAWAASSRGPEPERYDAHQRGHLTGDAGSSPTAPATTTTPAARSATASPRPR